MEAQCHANVDNTVLLAKSEEDLQILINKSSNFCVRRKLKVTVGKSKVIYFIKKKTVTEFVDQ